MANSTATKPTKKSDFPLYKHPSGRWYKKVKGKFCYFGKVSDDPKGEKALVRWLDEKDALLAGRKPRRSQGGLTIAELCNRFLEAKERRLATDELQASTFHDYLRVCKEIAAAFGRDRLVDDLAADDFEKLRATLAKKYGITRLGNTIVRVRSVFKYGLENDLMEKPAKFGSEFRKPKKSAARKHLQHRGKLTFAADEIHKLLAAASPQLRAMIYLGINCGFGNNDCASLPLSNVDLDASWLDFPRPKTAIERRCPLWPETVSALREAIASRPEAKKKSDADFVFVTKYGHSWAKELGFKIASDENGSKEMKATGNSDPVGKAFRKLINKIDNAAADAAKTSGQKPQQKMYRRGVGFYTLRRQFEIVGGESRDQVAVDAIMGHADETMAAVYRQGVISDERLRAVVDRVRYWLLPQSVNSTG